MSRLMIIHPAVDDPADIPREAELVREPEVEDGDVGAKAAKAIAGGRAVARFVDVKVVRLQKASHAKARTLFVINE